MDCLLTFGTTYASIVVESGSKEFNVSQKTDWANRSGQIVRKIKNEMLLPTIASQVTNTDIRRQKRRGDEIECLVIGKCIAVAGCKHHCRYEDVFKFLLSDDVNTNQDNPGDQREPVGNLSTGATLTSG
jgi:hypothetical protein